MANYDILILDNEVCAKNMDAIFAHIGTDYAYAKIKYLQHIM